jgi:hypothetical protein
MPSILVGTLSRTEVCSFWSLEPRTVVVHKSGAGTSGTCEPAHKPRRRLPESLV